VIQETPHHFTFLLYLFTILHAPGSPAPYIDAHSGRNQYPCSL